METVLTTHFANEAYRHLEAYRRFGGYEALRKAFAMEPQQIIDEVRKANLRGRGGAASRGGEVGVPSERSLRPACWSSTRTRGSRHFKDRLIMTRGRTC